MITIGSIFAGIGGLDLGVERAFAAAGLPARVAWQVEIDAGCRAVLAEHWPEADRSVDDVCAVSLRVLPRVDILIGGPPCQGISGAGLQEGLSDERSGLLFQYLRIVRELRPVACIVENVYGGKWRTWLDTVRCGFESVGYPVRAGKLRAADVGAPHERARVFVVAYVDSPELRIEQGRIGGQGGPYSAFARRCGESGSAPRSSPKPRMGRSRDGVSDRVDIGDRWPSGRGEPPQAWEPSRTCKPSRGRRRARLKALGNAVVPQCAEIVTRELVVPLFNGLRFEEVGNGDW